MSGSARACAVKPLCSASESAHVRAVKPLCLCGLQHLTALHFDAAPLMGSFWALILDALKRRSVCVQVSGDRGCRCGVMEGIDLSHIGAVLHCVEEGPRTHESGDELSDGD